MAEPTTEAGRRAQYELCHFDRCAGLRGPNDCDCGVVKAIHAIEDEGRAAVWERGEGLDVIRCRYANLGHDATRKPLDTSPPGEMWLWQARQDVLALLRNEGLLRVVAAERKRIVGFVQALISEATKPNGDRRDAHWLDEVVADLMPDSEALG